MAQFQSLFTTDLPGTPPVEWVPLWGGGGWAIAGGIPGSVDGLTMRLPPNAQWTPQAIQWTRPGLSLDAVEVLVRVYLPGRPANVIARGTMGAVGVRMGGREFYRPSDSTKAVRGYVLMAAEDFLGTTLRIVKLAPGASTGAPAVQTVLGSFGLPGPGAGWYFARLRANGTSLQGKMWGAAEAEPAGWQVDVVDATYSAGAAGLYAGGQWDLYWDGIGVGTAGDAATLSLPSLDVPPYWDGGILPGVQDLTVFSEDDTTPIRAGDGTRVGVVHPLTGDVLEATFSTHPGHPRPWLSPIDTASESRVDLKEGTGFIGQTNVELLDKRRVATDQDTGFLTWIIPSGWIGRRAVVRQQRPDGTWAILQDGVLGALTLGTGKDVVFYRSNVRDIRERERKLRAFVRADTSVMYPLGVTMGYGRYWTFPRVGLPPQAAYLVPETPGHRGTFRVNGTSGRAGRVELYYRLPGGSVTTSNLAAGAAIKAARLAQLDLKDDLDARGRPITVYNPAGAYFARRFSYAIVQWRPVSALDTSGVPTGPWRTLADMPVVDNTPLKADHVFQWGFQGSIVGYKGGDLIKHIVVNSDDPALMPTNGQLVEVRVLNGSTPTERFPLYWEGNLWTLAREVYDGKYSDPGAPRVRYNAARFAQLEALQHMGRAIITELAENALDWLKDNVYKPEGYAPAFDGQGAIYPISYALPDGTVPLPQVTDVNTDPEGSDWRHATDDVVTEVQFIYQRDYLAEDDPDAPATPLARLRSVDQQHIRQAATATLHGVKRVEFKPVTYRALATTPGGVTTLEQAEAELGRQAALLRSTQLLDRFSDGAQRLVVRCRRSDAAISGVQVGDWVQVALSWMPDYVTRRRGINRLAQVVKARELDPAWRELELVDAGPFGQPVARPLVTDVGPTDDLRVTFTVGVLPFHAAPGQAPRAVEARVDIAVNPTVPDTDSGLWEIALRTQEAGAFLSRQIAVGSTVWVRWRGELAGQRPSGWAAPVQVTIADQPTIRDVTLQVSDGRPVVRWTSVSQVAAVRVYYQVHAAGSAVPGALGSYVDVDGDLGETALPPTLRQYEQVTVQVVPYTTFVATVAGGLAGAPTPLLTAQRNDVDVILPLVRVIRDQFTTSGTLTLDVYDPQLRAGVPEFQTTVGKDAPSAWFPDSVVPYQASVTLVEQHTSSIAWRLAGVDSAGNAIVHGQGIVEFRPADKPEAPAVVPGVGSTGAVVAQITGSLNQDSVKVLASTLGQPTAADVRTSGAVLSGRVVTSGTLLTLPAGSRAWIGVLAYSATGEESTLVLAPADRAPAGGAGGGADTSPPHAYITETNDDDLNATLAYSGALGVGGVGPLQYRRQVVDNGVTGAWSAFAALPGGPENIPRAAKRTKLVRVEVQDTGNGQTGDATYTVRAQLEAIDVATGRVKRPIPLDDGSYAAKATDTAGTTLDVNVSDSAARPVRRLLAKALASDPDTADSLLDGLLRRVPTLNEATGGGRAFTYVDAGGEVNASPDWDVVWADDFDSDTRTAYAFGNMVAPAAPVRSVITLQGSTPDPIATLGAGAALPTFTGGEWSHVLIRYRCPAASTPGTGTVFYSTAGHGISGSFFKNWNPIGDGEWHTAALDMHALSSGGTDWRDNTITGLRIDPLGASGIAMEVDAWAVAKKRLGQVNGTLGGNTQDTGGRTVRRLLAKPLAGDPDSLDAVTDGITWRRVASVDGSNQVGTGGIANLAIVASKISVTNLAAISAALGVVSTGLMRNAAATRGVRLDAASGSLTGYRSYLDLDPAGSFVLYVADAGGTVVFSVSSTGEVFMRGALQIPSSAGESTVDAPLTTRAKLANQPAGTTAGTGKRVELQDGSLMLRNDSTGASGTKRVLGDYSVVAGGGLGAGNDNTWGSLSTSADPGGTKDVWVAGTANVNNVSANLPAVDGLYRVVGDCTATLNLSSPAFTSVQGRVRCRTKWSSQGTWTDHGIIASGAQVLAGAANGTVSTVPFSVTVNPGARPGADTLDVELTPQVLLTENAGGLQGADVRAGCTPSGITYTYAIGGTAQARRGDYHEGEAGKPMGTWAGIAADPADNTLVDGDWWYNTTDRVLRVARGGVKSTIGANLGPPRILTTGNYTLSANDSVVVCDTSGGNIGLTLPDTDTIPGHTWWILKVAAANQVTVTTAAGETIRGNGTLSWTRQWMAYGLVARGGGTNAVDIVAMYEPPDLRTVLTADLAAIGTTAGGAGIYAGLPLEAGKRYRFRGQCLYTVASGTALAAFRAVYSGTLGTAANGNSQCSFYGTSGNPTVWAAASRQNIVPVNGTIPTTTGGIGATGAAGTIAAVDFEGEIFTATAGTLQINAIASVASGFIPKAGSWLEAVEVP